MADDSRKTAVCDRRDDSEEDQHNENQDDDDEVESVAVDEVKTLQRSRIGASIGAHSGDNSRDEVYVDELKSSPDTNSTIELMKKMLPEYAVNCFLSAGYDEMSVLCNFDISNNPNNGIAKVEDFINRRFSSNPNHNPRSLVPFEFPPGHREKICNFVQELKCLEKRTGKKRSNLYTESSTAIKRSKVNTYDCSGSVIPKPDVTIESVYKQIRHRLNEWKKKLEEDESHLKLLKEEEHYSIQVIPQMSSGFFKVLMRCHNSMKCSSKGVKLHQKNPQVSSSPFSISNWTKHVRSCFDKKSVEHHNDQPQLKKCFSSRNDKGPTVSSDTVINLMDSSNNSSGKPFNVIPVNVENVSKGVESYIESREMHSSPQINVVNYNHSQSQNSMDNRTKFLSWSNRKKRSLVKAASDPSQTRITDYLTMLDSIEKLTAENKRLSMLLSQLELTENGSKHTSSPASFTNILRQIFSNAEKNSGQYPTHRRHLPILKKFSTVLFILAGPLAYELIQQNMPEALPCIRTVQSAIHSEYETIDEGVFRFNELRQHLDQYDVPLCVSIAEDATRVVGRVDYDAETDRCVGFVLPLNEKGLPIVDSFIAISFPAIQKMFIDNVVSKYAYVYMAQPLCGSAPPMLLACLGTDNKFKAKEVMLRWKYIIEQCAERHIKVLSFGSDGDSRLMKSMKVSTSFKTPQSEPLIAHLPSNALLHAPTIPPNWLDWYHIEANGICYVQDIVHTAVKLKGRLLKPQIVLPMGKYFVSSSHLHAVKLTFQKDKHGLRQRDIDHKDKQNFQAVMNITSAGHLLAEIPQANATKCYVDLIRNVIDSYLDKSLDPLERLEKLWYVVFFLRYWRKWITLNKSYTLGNNFITSNAYNCIELNAHALINYIIAIRDDVKEIKCFVPWLLGSQCCEVTFRAARSMSSIYSTVINFGMLGLLRRLHRLQIQLAIQAETQADIVYPRLLKHQHKVGKNAEKDSITLLMASNEQILGAVQRGQTRAKAMIEELGMSDLYIKHSLWDSNIRIKGIDGGIDRGSENNDDDDNDDSDEDNEECSVKKEVIPLGEETHDVLLAQEECSVSDVEQIAYDLDSISKCNLLDPSVKEHFKECHKSFKRLPSTTIPMYERAENQNKKVRKSTKPFSTFLEIKAPNNETVFIRKSTAVWLLQEGERVSTDRLFRVRHKQPYNSEIQPKGTIPATAAVSFTAKLDQIKIINSPSPKKQNTLDTVKGTTDTAVIDITDLPSESDEEIDNDVWVKVEGKKLRNVDKEVILNGKWLWGTHLTVVQLLLKKRYTDINGLIDASVFVHKDQTISTGSVQILHVNGNHWITISTMQCSDSNFCDVVVYDSLHFHLSQATKVLLARLIKTSRKELIIKIANTHKQAGSDDCGLFSAAYCTSLVNHQDPSLLVYNQDAMRAHLVRCLESKAMECFPVIRNRRSGTARYDKIAVFCYCRCPDDGSKMIQCDGKKCKEWFHQSCIYTNISKGKKWYCSKCS